MNRSARKAVLGAGALLIGGGLAVGIYSIVNPPSGPRTASPPTSTTTTTTTLPPGCVPAPALHSNETFNAPAGACYATQGIRLAAVTNLTVNGGLWIDTAQPQTSPLFWLTGQHTCLRQLAGPPQCSEVGPGADTFENLAIQGSWVSGGRYAANGAAIRSDGTVGLTISNVTVTGVSGDGLNLEPLRLDNGPTIVNPGGNVTVSNMQVLSAGRRCWAPVSVNGALFTNVSCQGAGESDWDFEADQDNEGAQNVTVNGCVDTTPGDVFTISSDAAFTGPITIENCHDTTPAATVAYIRSLTGRTEAGQILFQHDTYACKAPGPQACFNLQNGNNVAVTSSVIRFVAPGSVALAVNNSHITFTGDTVVGYGRLTLYPIKPDSTLTQSGGLWAPRKVVP